MTATCATTSLTFDDKDAAERVPLGFNFGALLDEVALSPAPVITVTRLAGVLDAAPEDMLDGAPQVDGATVLQWVAGGINGTQYSLRCEATGADGEIYVLVGIMRVRKAG